MADEATGYKTHYNKILTGLVIFLKPIKLIVHETT